MPIGVSAAMVALAACDSGLPVNADLGQGGVVPAVSATVGAPSSAGTPLTFSAPLPADWTTASSVKLVLSGQQLPLSPAATGTFATVVPATIPFTRPLDGSATTLPFVVNGDHTEVASVTFH